MGDVANNGTLAFNRNDTSTFAGMISGTGSVRQDGTGTTVLTAANSYSGGTTISAGVLQLGNGGTTGSIQGDIVNNSVLAFNRSDILTVPSAISGTGSVRQEGTGTTVLTAANTYSGPTAVNSGTLRAGGVTVFSAASQTTVASAGTLDLDGFDQVLAGLSNAGAVRLSATANTALTVAGNYVGRGGTIRLSSVLGGDGSAFHLAPFSMQPGSRVGLIQRRHRPKVFDAFTAQIEAFAQSEVSLIRPVLPKTDDTPHPSEAAPPIDFAVVEEELDSAGFL